MKFHFSIKQAVRDSWHTVFAHTPFFLLLGGVFVLMGVCSNSENIAVMIVAGIAQFIWGYVQVAAGLAAIDGKKALLVPRKLSSFFPDMMSLLEFLAVSVLVVLAFLAGLVALVIPGIYALVRLSFAKNAYVDRKEGVIAALRYSWDITRDHFWLTLWGNVVVAAILLFGLILFFVGLVVAYPVAIVFQSALYRAIASEYQAARAIEIQPEELPVHASEEAA